MTIDDALAALVGDPHARRYRELCAEDNPDIGQRDAYRGLVVRLASGDRPAPPPAVHYREADAPRPCGGCPGTPAL